MTQLQREKAFEVQVKNFLKEQGCWVLKTWGGGFQRSGVPDLLICHNGHFIAVELKAANGKPSALQEWNIEEIKKAGGTAMVLFPKDFEDFKEIIRRVKK